jgi:hypothetical protein
VWGGHSCPPLLIRRAKIKSVIGLQHNKRVSVSWVLHFSHRTREMGHPHSLREIYDAGLKLSVSNVWVDAGRPFIR